MLLWIPAISVFVLASAAHILKDGQVVEEGFFQRWLHKLYASHEVQIIRMIDRLLKNRFLNGTRLGRAFLRIVGEALWFLPHGVVVDKRGVERLIEYVSQHDSLHIAIGPCLCKKAVGVREEPFNTDMTILYGAEVYKSAMPGEYRFISGDEALRLLEEFRKNNLVHEVFACMHSGSWLFAICNCDKRYCIPTRSFLLTGVGVYPGPLVASVDAGACKGCGECVKVCAFGATEVRDGKAIVDQSKCMGCGLCVERCPENARALRPREGYKPKLIPLHIMYPELAGGRGHGHPH